jgi:hypothetical protein
MTELGTSPPPPRATEIERWVLDSGTQLQGLRAALHRALTGQVADTVDELDDIPERVVLVATELATNALRHGRPPTVIRLLRADDLYVLDVADGDMTRAPELATARPPGSGGLGLQLAQQVSLEVGWYATAAAKHIWASFPSTGPP